MTHAVVLRRWYEQHRGWIGYLAIFSIAFVVFTYFQYVPVFADPDSFYHAKVAVLLRDGNFSTTFGALPFTTLADSFADQHFLYHLLLIPFVSWFDPLIGLKIATVVLGSLMTLSFYWFLRRWGIPWAFITTVLLLAVNPFSFRMNLAKASSLSLILLLLGLAAAFSYRPWIVLALSFWYVWFYGGFALLAVGVVTFVVVSVLHRRFMRRENANILLHRIRAILGRKFRHRRVQRLNLRMVVAVMIGTFLGLIINPFFPSNLRFYYDQLIRIGAINYQRVIGVGGEWYPYKFIELVANTVLVSIPLVVAIVLFVLFFRKQSSRSITLFIVWLFFFVLTLKSRRYVEYYVPFGLLFAAFSLNDSLGIHWRKLWRNVRGVLYSTIVARVGVVAFITYVAILLPTVVARDFVSEKKDLAKGFRLDLFKAESEWIMDHGQQGSIVFHSDWDEFPVLYYFNSESRYIAGLDPTFLYLKDQQRYHDWANITLGKESGDAYHIIKNRFNASFVFIEHDHGEMERLIRDRKGFTLAFSGPDANVYRVE